MKATKFILAAAAVALSMSAFSQQEPVTKDKNDTETKEAVKSTWGNYPPAKPVNDNAELNQPKTGNWISFPAPNFGNYYIPVLGSYNSVEATAGKTITVTGDEKNAGRVWIEGLAPVKVFALLKAVPGTYKIPAQKQDNRQIQEGTLIYDETSKQISICLGCGFKDQNPADVVATESSVRKNHKSTINFTGVKNDQGTVSK